MFFERKWARIQGNAEYSISGDCACPRAPEGEGKKLSDKLCKVRSERTQQQQPTPLSRVHMWEGKWATNRANCDTGVSKVKKLIKTGYEDGPEEPNRPCAKGISRHLHVIRVGDGGPHFGVGRLVFPFY